MPKNILIFSDGTGQSGGIEFDENRSNIYKLYRATRCGPDTGNNPDQQIAFYDPGLGSPADGGFMFGKTGRRIYNIVSQATGLGITANIIDCYAALIRLYREGDRVFLFGFSRGSYTVRCLAGVLTHCGIPRRMPSGKPLPMDLKGSRALAARAVRDVYQFCSSRPYEEGASYRNFMLDTRKAIAKRFRAEHGSSQTDGAEDKANVFPYFIGVFDTVAALGRTGAMILLFVFLALLVPAASLLLSLLTAFEHVTYLGWLHYVTYDKVSFYLWCVGGAVAVYLWLKNYLKFDLRVPGYGFFNSLATIHFAEPKQKFYDYTLNVNVEYAKHAISIDEDRKDFSRVRWEPTAEKANTRDAEKNLYFEQVWFAGVHSNIGGGYTENESRLSDITLNWMLAAASIIPNGIEHDQSLLCLFPDAKGPQHDECKAGIWQRGVRKLPSTDAPVHRSVYARFEANDGVVQYDVVAPYRPENMKDQDDFKHYYDANLPRPKNLTEECDDIEYKWEVKKKVEAATKK